MKAYRALAFFLGLVQICDCFKPNLPPLKDAQVLVVGASGQVGEQVRVCRRMWRCLLFITIILPKYRTVRELYCTLGVLPLDVDIIGHTTLRCWCWWQSVRDQMHGFVYS